MALEGTQIVIASTSTELFKASSNSSVEAAAVTRLNANGTFDTSFNGSGKLMLSLSEGGTAFNTAGSSITTLSDGSLLLGGTAFEQNTYAEGSSGMLAEADHRRGARHRLRHGGVALLTLHRPV